MCSIGGEGLGDGSGQFPLFRTGSGKSVTVKRSSIRKAASVLGGENEENGNSSISKDGTFSFIFFLCFDVYNLLFKHFGICKLQAGNLNCTVNSE